MADLAGRQEDASDAGIRVSIVIPMYNERDRILSTLEDFRQFLEKKDYGYEILVADDYSSDDTVDIVRGFVEDHPVVSVLKNQFGKGKGGAVKTGVLRSKGEFVLFSDADASTPIHELDHLLSEMAKGYDIVIGSRGLSDSRILVHQPFYREWMGRTFNFLVQHLLVKGIYDTQCGFKLFKGATARELFSKQRIDGFSFDVEVLYLAQKSRCKIKETPVDWGHSENSRVSLFRDSIKMFFDLLKIRFLG